MDELGTGLSSDTDSDLLGPDWGDDPVATINSVTGRNDSTRGGKEKLAFVDSGAFDNVVPKLVVPSIRRRRPPSRRAELELVS